MKMLSHACLALALTCPCVLAESKNPRPAAKASDKAAPGEASKPAASVKAAPAPAKEGKPATDATAASPKKAPNLPPATMADVKYGPHERNVLSFWKASSREPTPVVIFIHGGGWMSGDRTSGLSPILTGLLDAGISVVSVEYRMIPDATKDGEVPPVRGPMYDAARAVQFVRSKAKEWNLDKSRVAASGGSAGACTSLWLAFHADLADPASKDPVLRESTRLTCAAVSGAQTTLDPQQMREWIPNSRYGGHAFGITGNKEKKISQFDEFYASRERLLPWIAEYSPYALVTADDPAVYLIYSEAPSELPKDPTHSANFGVKLQEHLKATGVACELVYPGAPDVKHPRITDYLIARLKPAAAK